MHRALAYAPGARPATAGDLMRRASEALRPPVPDPEPRAAPTPQAPSRGRAAKAALWAATAIFALGVSIPLLGGGDEDRTRRPQSIKSPYVSPDVSWWPAGSSRPGRARRSPSCARLVKARLRRS
jgi:hypothetical protein